MAAPQKMSWRDRVAQQPANPPPTTTTTTTSPTRQTTPSSQGAPRQGGWRDRAGVSGGSSQGGWRDRAGQAPSQGDNKKGWETRNSGYSNSGWGNNQGGAGNKQGGGWGEPRNRGGRSGRSGRGDDLRLIFTQASLEKCGVPPSETMRRAGEVEALNKSESIQEFIELATNVNGQYMHCTLGRFANAFDEEIINMMPDFVFPPSRECRLKLKMPRVFGNPGDRKVFLDIEFPSEVDEYIKELEKKVECFRKSSIEPHIMIAKEKYDEEHYKNVLECIEEWKKKEEEGKGKGEGEAILVIQELRVEMASNQSPNEPDRIYTEGKGENKKPVTNRKCLWYSPKEEGKKE